MKHVALLSLGTLLSTVALAACSSGGGEQATGSAGSATTGTGSSTAGTGGSTSGTGGSTSGTGGSTFVPGMPITATDSTWTWIPFPDSACGNGSPTGIGVNLSTKSSRVLVYLEGGGACWSDLTCNSVKTAANFTGYDEAQFTSESAQGFGSTASGNFFDRTSAANPFQDYSYVFVPYCTGDIHAGNNLAKYAGGTGHHVGFANMTAYLKRIVPTFPTADRVILAGSSAGGYGAAFNWWQTQEAFGKIRVDMIDDSGTPMPPDVEATATGFGFAANGAGESLIRASWGLAGTFPPGCTGCTTRLDALFGFYAKTYPDHRAALLSFTQDSVLPTFYGISTAEFTMGLNEEIAATFTAANPGFQYFAVDQASHVLWFTPSLTPTTTSSATLQQFITQMVTDDKSWTSEHP